MQCKKFYTVTTSQPIMCVTLKVVMIKIIFLMIWWLWLT